MQFERNLTRQIVGSRSHKCLKSTWFGSPLALCLVVEAEGIAADGQRDILTLAWLEEDFLESFQLFHGAIYRALLVADVELNSLATGTATRIGDIDRELTQLEGGIAKTMSEGEKWTDLLLVSPAIANVDALLILLVDNLIVVAPDTREGVQGMCATIIKALIPREGELA